MAILLSASGITKQFGVNKLFDGLTINIQDGERIGIIGPNGRGKSTFLRMLAGVEDLDAGSITKSKNLSVSYATQLVPFADEGNVQSLLDAEFAKYSKQGLEFDIYTVLSYLDQFEIKDLEAPLSSLSGGQKKKVHLSFVLAESSELLLLDEPSNHLDLDSIIQLESILSGLSTSILMISHDRWLLEAFSEQILEINPIYPEGYFLNEGGYFEYIRRRDEFLEADRKALESMGNKARAEQAWLRQGAKARTTKSKHRSQTAQDLIKAVKQNTSRRHVRTAQIEFQSSDRKTKRLLEFDGVGHGFGDKKLFSNFSHVVLSGEKYGILGPNGSGKSTILKLILDEYKPESGELKPAYNLKVSYFSQFSSHIDEKVPLERVLSEDSDSVVYQGRSIHVASWASRFGFDSKNLKQPYGSLSGGEKAKLRIAKLMLETPDVLLLDEPTNDLDIQTLEILEDSLLDFSGALILVTHDRFLMSSVCENFIGLDGYGGIKLYASYDQYVAELGKLNSAQGNKTLAKDKESEVDTQSIKSEASKNKLSYKDKRDYDLMEGNIRRAEEKAQSLQAKIAECSDGDKLKALCDDLGKVQADINSLYARWEELEKLLG